ncbi:MAG: hypothetical protein LWY06_16820 [Firmicutes bacterium]|nr:hypothetical protein [Bacillota bacterium]
MKNLKPAITAAIIIAVFIIGAVAMAQFNKMEKQKTLAAESVTVTAAEKGPIDPPEAMLPPGGGPDSSLSGGPGSLSGGPGSLPGGPVGITGGPGGMRGPGSGPMGSSSRPGFLEPVSSDDIKEFETWMKKEDPQGYAEIQDLKTVKPMEYGRIVFEFTRNMRLMKMLEKRDPEAYKGLKDEMVYDLKLRKLCREYREAGNDGKKAQIKTELNETLDKLFDIRTANRQREIGKLDEKVKELRGLLEKRKSNKKLIVERKLQEVTGSSDGLEW